MNNTSRPEPTPFELYRHFKGNTYQILNLAKHSETGEKLVIYQALYGDFGIYARPLDMFLSEVDKNKYPETSETFRFTKLEQTDENKLIKDCQKFTAESEAAEITVQAQNTSKIQTKNPQELFIEFLDEDDFEKKRTILKALYGKATDSMINNMAASLDLVPSDKGREANLKMIDDYVRARIHFDGLRLRG